MKHGQRQLQVFIWAEIFSLFSAMTAFQSGDLFYQLRVSDGYPGIPESADHSHTTPA